MEHNAVMRPLTQLAARGVTFSRAQCAQDGTLKAAEVERLINPRTRLVVMTHASNVCGTVLPVKAVGETCRAHGVPLVVDVAQTAGVIPLDVRECGASAVCFTGHKGLLGPQGTGGCVLDPAFAEGLEALVAGGTGSSSDSEEMPSFMPDRLEAGTPNLPGLAGLAAALGWLEKTGMDAVRAHEQALTQRLIDGLAPLADAGRVRLVGLPPQRAAPRVSIQTPATTSPRWPTASTRALASRPAWASIARHPPTRPWAPTPPAPSASAWAGQTPRPTSIWR